MYKFLKERLLSLGPSILYELHYAMISLGKTFCSKRSPHCSQCPVAEHCEYQASGCCASPAGWKLLRIVLFEPGCASLIFASGIKAEQKRCTFSDMFRRRTEA